MTVADYISRAESQSRQRPPVERTKPSEDSLSGQKVGNQDTAYPTFLLLLLFIWGRDTENFAKKVELTVCDGVQVKLRVEQSHHKQGKAAGDLSAGA